MKSKLVATTAVTALLIAPAAALASNGSSPDAMKGSISAQATVNRQIPLKLRPTYRPASGSAQYQAQPGQREFQIEIDKLAPLAGTSLLVRVNAANVGSMKVSSMGIAQLTRNSELGQRVPMVEHGSIVTVKTGAGTIIASGVF